MIKQGAPGRIHKA